METFNRMPWAAKNSVFQKLAEVAEVSNLSKEDRIKYDAALRHFRDTLNVMRGAEEKGRKEGRMEGRMEGRKEGRKEGMVQGRKEGENHKALAIAKKMKEAGSDIDFIKEMTGLTEDEIRQL